MFSSPTWDHYQGLIRETRLFMYDEKIGEELLYVVSIGKKKELGVDDEWLDWVWFTYDMIQAHLEPPNEILNPPATLYDPVDEIKVIFLIESEWILDEYCHLVMLRMERGIVGHRPGEEGPRARALREVMGPNWSRKIPLEEAIRAIRKAGNGVTFIDYRPPMQGTKEWYWVIKCLRTWAVLRDRHQKYRAKVSESLQQLSTEL